MTRLAYLDCVGGIAGDMLLAGLVDAGASVETLRALPDRLGLSGVRVDLDRVDRHGCAAAHVTVHAPGSPPERRWREIRTLLEEADLPPRAAARSLAAFTALAEAEARVHRVPVDEIHFHEVGGDDALVDICGVCLLLDELDVARVAASSLPFARGFTRSAHGRLPLPAPATLELLAGAPLVGVDENAELVTPTGAALIATLVDVWGLLPPLVLERIGVGAGTRDLAGRPNVVRVLLGAESGEPTRGLVSLLETNLDDLLPELVPDAMRRCLEAGALDTWVTPVQMKKGRPGFLFSVLARPQDEARIAATILEETTALGVRVSRLARYELDRSHIEVEVGGQAVRVKLGRVDGRVVNVSPEHDDCVAAAHRLGRSVKSVWIEAVSAAHA
ncbi:MAG TPA: nickel pincer cofactor biosynthesis protein LarC [Gaiellaceae bacterium]|nr:nickel pincer cofactor biosynthesis protein LarC [Gaiellaceae bacterium]